MNGAESTAQWMNHQPKHVETMTKRVSSQQQCARWVERHRSDWMTGGMSYKVSNQSNTIRVFLHHHLSSNSQSVSCTTLHS